MMPSTSKKQHNFMAAVANNPAFAKKVGVPQSVGKDFSTADKGRKFSKGGDMKESKAMVKKEIGFMKKAGAPKSMIKHEKAEMGMKKGGMPAALAKHAAKPASKAHAGLKEGGMAMVMKDGKKIPAFAADGEGKMKKGGGVNEKVSGMGYSSGGVKKMMGGGMAKTVMPGSRGAPTPFTVDRKPMPGSRGAPTAVGSGFNSRVLPQRDNSMQRLPVGGVKPMAKGGGIESRGKTKGKII